MRAVLPLACVFALALVGCGDDPIVIVPDDTGGGGGADAGTDANTAAPDAPTTPACPPASAPPPTPDQCDAATLDCLVAAGTSQPMQMACLDADSTGDECLACLNGEVLAACTTSAAGCDDELGLVNCCLEDACPTGDMACVQAAGASGGACAAQANTMVMCVNTAVMSRTCGNTPTLCFRDAPPSP
jgi:hypothetical protein